MTEQAAVSYRIQVGDTVALTQDFIDRNSLDSNSMTFVRGEVTAVRRMSDGVIMADIEWNKPGLSKRVNAKNLIKLES